jgi:hypothetical protein
VFVLSVVTMCLQSLSGGALEEVGGKSWERKLAEPGEDGRTATGCSKRTRGREKEKSEQENKKQRLQR